LDPSAAAAAANKAQKQAEMAISEQKQPIAGVPLRFVATENIALPIDTVPAQTLDRRVDVAIAETNIRAAAAQIVGAAAQGLPSISLLGNIGPSVVRAGGRTTDGVNWQIGPIAVSLPLTRKDLTKAEVEAAQAGYAASIAAYKATVRNAAREVESALDALATARERLAFTQTASEGYSATFNATEARQRAGLASTLELEDARRLRLAADTALLDARNGLLTSYVTLFVATGGGIDARLSAVAQR
jgi:outer membrane protein, multidrug efflux system